MPRCGIVILAAGASTRMGVAKQSLEFEGATLLMRAVKTALASVCRPVVVVLGARADELRDQLSSQPVQVVINENWAPGMGTSIRAGVAEIAPASLDAVLIFLCDQPLVSAAVLNQMAEQHFTGAKGITAAFYGGTFGTPAIFSAAFFDQLLALEDSQGGKALMRKYPDQIQSFPLPEAEVDVDSPADFQRLLKRDPKK